MKQLCAILLIFSVFIAYPADYYWVGGSGNWTDFANHWATTSGGTEFHRSAPTTIDNVFIDDNSFTADGTITLDDLGYCHDFDASGLTRWNVDLTPVTYNGQGADYLYIYGSMTGSSFYRSGLFYTYFLSTDIETVTSNGGDLGVYLIFEEVNGSWNIMDDISGITGIKLNMGSLLIETVESTTIRFFDVANSSNFKSLTLTDLYLDTDFFRIGNNNLTYRFTNTTVAVEDAFEVYANPMQVDDVIFLNLDQLNVEGEWTMDNLTIEPGSDVTLLSGDTLTINQLMLGGEAETFIRSSTPGLEATLSQASGAVEGAFLNLTDIHAVGGATFTATGSIDNGNNVGWTFIKDYYWVGGDGNWTDFANHWATTSGGTTFHTTVPSTLDNVYIDDNSFTMDGTIMLDDLGYCHDFDASGLTNFNVNLSPVTYNGTGADYLYIHGSFTGSAKYSSGLFYTYLLSTDTETVTANGGDLGVYLRFEEANGTWNIMDDVSSLTGIALNLGSLVISEVDTTAIRFFDVANSSNFKSLTLSNLYLDTDFFRIGNNNLNYSITNTTIAVDNQFEVYANPMEVDDVIFLNRDALNVEGSWTMDNLTIEPGSDVTLLSGDTLTINQLMLGGEAETFIRSSTPGSEATLSQASGAVEGAFLNLTDIHAAGGATFTATGSIDNGNNVGWTFIKDYYWVGGDGNWTDFANHWATTSGGTTFHTTVPSTLDNVYIDDNSFTMDGTITLDDLGYCNDFDASGLTNFNVDLTPVTYNGTGADYLYIHGSMIGSANFNSGLFYTYFLGTGPQEIISNGGRLGVYLRFEHTLGNWFIKDDISAITGIALNMGSLSITEVDTTTIRFFDVANSGNFKALFLSDLYLNTSFFRIGNANLVYTIDNTTIAVGGTNGGDFEVYTNPMQVDDVIFKAGSNLDVAGDWTIDHLTIESGASVTMQGGSTQTINQLVFPVGELQTLVHSSTPGVAATFSQATGEVTGENLNLQDIHATGGAVFTASGSIDNGNNVGWTFLKDYYWVGGDGNWTDFANHWATTSGGTIFHTSVPGPMDNVYIDDNSFILNGTITLDDLGYCHDFDVSGLSNVEVDLRPVTYNGTGADFLYIHGSMTGSANFYSALFYTYFLSTGVENITSNGGRLGAYLRFEEASGTWNIKDDLSAITGIALNLGSLVITEVDTTTIRFFDVANSSNFKSLTLSNLYLNAEYFRIGNNNLDYSINNTTISVGGQYGGDFEVYSNPMQVDDVVFRNLNQLDVAGNWTMDNLTIEPGADLIIRSGDTLTMNQLVLGGEVETLIKSSALGDEAFFSQASGDVIGENLNIRDIHAIGGATFTAVASRNEGNNTGWEFASGDQTINFTLDPDTVDVFHPSFELMATATSGLGVYFTSSNEGVATITGDRQLSVVGPGFTTITAKQDGNSEWNPAPDVEQVLVVVKADQQINFTEISDATFGDDPVQLFATSSSGNEVFFSTSDENVISIVDNFGVILGAGAVSLTASQPGDINYNPASVTQEVVVNKANQTITFNALSDFVLGVDTSIVLDATTTSGLEIAYTVEGNATLNGNILTPFATGIISVTASQIGDINYNPAPDVTRTLSVVEATKQDQTINFTPVADKTFGDASFELSATASSGLPVVFASSDPSVITVNGTTASIVGAGTVTLTASQAGDSTYNSASASQEVIVNKANQTITFDEVLVKTYGDADFDLSAASSSGLEVFISSSNENVISISGIVGIINGAGTVTLTASQPGNNNYNPASVSQEVVVNKADQSITFQEFSDFILGGPPITLSASASSGLPVTYDVLGPATLDGNTLTPTAEGTVTITAKQLGDNNYNPAPDEIRSFNVIDQTKLDQTITFDPLPVKRYGDANFTLNATASSGLIVEYESSNPLVASVTGNVVAITGVGQVEIIAIQPGDESYNAATPVSQTLTVEKGLVTISINSLLQEYDGLPKEVSISTLPSGLEYDVTYDGSFELPVEPGEYAVVVTIISDLYEGVSSATFEIFREPELVTITVSNTEHEYDGSAKEVNVSLSMEVAYEVTYNGSLTPPVNAGSYQVHVEVIEQYYFGSADVTMNITKAPANVLFDNGSLTHTYDGTLKEVIYSTQPEGLIAQITYDGSAEAPVNAGTYAVDAVVDDINFEGSAQTSMEILKAQASVAFEENSLVQEFDGDPKEVVVITNPEGLIVTVTYDGSANPPVNAATYQVEAIVQDDNWEGSSTETLVVNPGLLLGSPLDKTISVYPNPAISSINIDCQSCEEFEWTIYNIGGQLVRKGLIPESHLAIELQGMPGGVYHLIIKGNAELHKFRIVIQ